VKMSHLCVLLPAAFLFLSLPAGATLYCPCTAIPSPEGAGGACGGGTNATCPAANDCAVGGTGTQCAYFGPS
jgi:hypothetical protein